MIDVTVHGKRTAVTRVAESATFRALARPPEQLTERRDEDLTAVRERTSEQRPDPGRVSSVVSAGSTDSPTGAAVGTVDPGAPQTPWAADWAALIGDQRADLVRIAHLRIRHDVSGVDAEDVVHEVFLRMVRRGPDPRGVSRPAAYLRQAVANECVTRWRRHREWAVPDTPDRTEHDHAERCVAALAVRQAMAALTPRQHSVITLGFLHGYTDAEVAAALGIQPVTVRTLRRRALDRMRVALADPEPSRPADLPGQEPNSMTRSGVSRSTTRTVPSGSVSYSRPRYFSDRVSINSRPPSVDMAIRPRISA